MTDRCTVMLHVRRPRGPRRCCKPAGHTGPHLTAIDRAVMTHLSQNGKDTLLSKRRNAQRKAGLL